jgi:hypothetical protein
MNTKDRGILISGVMIPLTLLSSDEKELEKLFKPKIDAETAEFIGTMIGRFFDLDKVFKPAVINLMPYPAAQLIEKPGDLQKIVVRTATAAYIVYLARNGYSFEDIEKITQDKKKFEEIFSNIPLLVTGYDYEDTKKAIENAPEELSFPLPEYPSKDVITEKLSSRVKKIMQAIGMKHIDVAFITISGNVTTESQVIEWVLGIVKRGDRLVDDADVLNETLERSYGLKRTMIRLFPLPAMFLDLLDETSIREFIENFADDIADDIDELVKRIIPRRTSDSSLAYL